jgi:hypothetical protein
LARTEKFVRTRLAIHDGLVTKEAWEYLDHYRKEYRRMPAKHTVYPPPKLVLVEGNVTRKNFDIFLH